MVQSVTDRTGTWLALKLREADDESTLELITRLIASGDLEPGVRLPTIRELARTTNTSLGSLAEAWSILRDRGLIVTRGRAGSFVAASGAALTPRRVRPTSTTPIAVQRFPGWQHVDLVNSQADLSLQPELRDALLASLQEEDLHAIRRDQVTPILLRALERTWPFRAQEFSTAGGGTEAVLLALEAAAPPGSVVAVDEPIIPGIVDTMTGMGIRAVGVECDATGPTPAGLQAALEQGPAAFVYQPSGPFGRNHVVTQERADELAELLAGTDVWIIEDDSLGPLASDDSVTMGELLPDQVLRVRSYCKAYGIDLRTAALGGTRKLVERVRAARSHGVAVNSRILQNALAHLIGGEVSAVSIELARGVYARRRQCLLDALSSEGLMANASPEGLVVWVEVEDETRALLDLAAHGIVLGEGRRAFASEGHRGYLRIAITHLPDDPQLVAELARTVRQAAKGELRAFLN